jgi:hypothetical protein
MALGGFSFSVPCHHHHFQKSISKGRFNHFHVIFICKGSCCRLSITTDCVLLQTVSAANFPVATGGELGLMIQLSAARGKHRMPGTIP